MANPKGNPEIYKYAKNQRQTGPRTPEAKLRVSLNARKNPVGLFSKRKNANYGHGQMDVINE